MDKTVRAERTDWRDSKLDAIHKIYGYFCPCDNVEFLMLEYDKSIPVAIVDYRLYGRMNSSLSRTVEDLCDNRLGPLPYVICEYRFFKNRIENIRLIPCNESAYKKFGKTRIVSEQEYVRLLYKCREDIVPGRTEQGVRIADSLPKFSFSSPEKWEGELISHRHRDWGWDCPVLDIDFIVVNNNTVSGIIEYKHSRSFVSPSGFKSHPSGKALCNLANTLEKKVPVLIIYYNDNFDSFRVYPLTNGWNKYDKYYGTILNRDEYFRFLKEL